MDVSRNYPKTELVLKRTHGYEAKGNVDQTKNKIKKHNEKFGKREKKYELRMPHAYPIGGFIVAMAKADFPSINEIIGDGPTRRGIDFFARLRAKHKTNEHELRLAMERLKKRTDGNIPDSGLSAGNTLLLGYKNGKFIFMPLIDLA